MKVRKLIDGEKIDVGDRIKVEYMAFGTRWETITRVTSKYAFVRINDKAESKYMREYRDFGFEPLPRHKWGTTNYSAWRPVAQSEPQEER